MRKLRVLRTHARTTGVGLVRRGDTYEESPGVAEEKVNAGFAEYADEVHTKEDPNLYRTSEATESVETKQDTDQELHIVEQNGPWYEFSDGEKVNGRKAAAEYLGVSVEELENVTTERE